VVRAKVATALGLIPASSDTVAGVAEEAVLNKVHKNIKVQKIPL
jgi:hypothetical protein